MLFTLLRLRAGVFMRQLDTLVKVLIWKVELIFDISIYGDIKVLLFVFDESTTGDEAT